MKTNIKRPDDQAFVFTAQDTFGMGQTILLALQVMSYLSPRVFLSQTLSSC